MYSGKTWCFNKNVYKREKYILLFLKKRTKEKNNNLSQTSLYPFHSQVSGKEKAAKNTTNKELIYNVKLTS